MRDTEAKKREVVVVGGAVPCWSLLLHAVQTHFQFTSHIRQDVAYEQYGTRVLELRKEIFRSDVARALGICIAGLLAIVALVKAWLKPQWVVLGCVLLLGTDLLNVDNRYVSDRNYTERLDKLFPFETRAADAEILRRERSAIGDFDLQFEEAKQRWEENRHSTDQASPEDQGCRCI